MSASAAYTYMNDCEELNGLVINPFTEANLELRKKRMTNTNSDATRNFGNTIQPKRAEKPVVNQGEALIIYNNQKFVINKSPFVIGRENADITICLLYTSTGQYRVILEEQVPGNLECVITIGGGGTLLHAAKDLEKLDVIFIGVNKGTLGFLAEISPEEMEGSIDRLLNDRFNVESRMMLCGQVIRNNEVVYKSNAVSYTHLTLGVDSWVAS